MGSKKGHSGLVVSSVDPALAANHSRVGEKVDGPAATIPTARLGDAPEPDLDPPAEPRASEPARTEITGTAGGFKDYTVRKGDSLWSIGREFGTSIAALRRANGMSGDKLVAGQTIRIPDPGARPATGREASGEGSDEVVATLPKDAREPAKDKAGDDLLETLPSGVVPPDPPRRSSTNLLEDEPAADKRAPVKKSDTTIGDDGFLRFGDE